MYVFLFFKTLSGFFELWSVPVQPPPFLRNCPKKKNARKRAGTEKYGIGSEITREFEMWTNPNNNNQRVRGWEMVETRERGGREGFRWTRGTDWISLERGTWEKEMLSWGLRGLEREGTRGFTGTRGTDWIFLERGFERRRERCWVGCYVVWREKETEGFEKGLEGLV